MCGRYYNRQQKQEIADRLRAESVSDEPFAPDYNIAPTSVQPVVRQKRDTDAREMVLARWGLVPFFAKSLDDFKGFTTFNARAETVATAPTWRGPFKARRCLVPVSGFYEWKKLDDRKKPEKQPYAIALKSGEPMAFAGLWDAWKESTSSAEAVGLWLQSFAIVTTEANELMAPIHNRMPVILAERDWKRWLDRDPDAPPPLDLLRPFDSDAMTTYACNRAVGRASNNGPEMLNSA